MHQEIDTSELKEQARKRENFESKFCAYIVSAVFLGLGLWISDSALKNERAILKEHSANYQAYRKLPSEVRAYDTNVNGVLELDEIESMLNKVKIYQR